MKKSEILYERNVFLIWGWGTVAESLVINQVRVQITAGRNVNPVRLCLLSTRTLPKKKYQPEIILRFSGKSLNSYFRFLIWRVIILSLS